MADSSTAPPIWLRPGAALSAIFAVTLLLFTVTSEDAFRVVYNAPKANVLRMYGYAAWSFGWLMLGMALVYAATPKTSRPLHDPSQEAQDYAFMRLLGQMSLALSVLAYAVFYVNAGISFNDLARGFSGEVGASSDLRLRLVNIPGVTSLVNVAPWWYAYIAFKRFILGKKLSIAEMVMSAGLFLAVALRAYAAFERHAIVDLFIPPFVLVLMYKRDWSRTARGFISIIPLVAVVAVVVLFLTGEYFKSWSNHYYAVAQGSYLDWGLARLGGYYVTAINNGALAFEQGTLMLGRNTLSGLFSFPGLGQLIGGKLEGGALSAFLERSANPEFNNPGGALAALIDFGFWGAAPFLFAHGMIFAYLYLGAARRRIVRTLLYSLAYFSVLEATRIWFFVEPFAILNLAYVPAVYLLYKIIPRRVRKSRPDPSARPVGHSGDAAA